MRQYKIIIKHGKGGFVDLMICFLFFPALIVGNYS